jgi:hypothetical protein
LILKPESEMDGRTVEAIIQQLIRGVPIVQDKAR